MADFVLSHLESSFPLKVVTVDGDSYTIQRPHDVNPSVCQRVVQGANTLIERAGPL